MKKYTCKKNHRSVFTCPNQFLDINQFSIYSQHEIYLRHEIYLQHQIYLQHIKYIHDISIMLRHQYCEDKIFLRQDILKTSIFLKHWCIVQGYNTTKGLYLYPYKDIIITAILYQGKYLRSSYQSMSLFQYLVIVII